MAGKTLDIDSVLTPDKLGTEIARQYIQWDTFRQVKVKEWREVREYIFATDTRKTSNAATPWKNTTTIPKLCQIRDNLYANYTAALFPKRKWLSWTGNDKDSNARAKREAIEAYMSYVIEQDNFKKEVDKLILDYIDYGNCFAGVDWIDETQQLADGQTKVGYVGPTVKRFSPLDIVFNPTAPDFIQSPKIIRSIVSLGEVKEILTRFSTDANKDQYEALWQYLRRIRSSSEGNIGLGTAEKDALYRVDGFHSYQAYLASGYCELLTFYGDIYDSDKDEFLRNQVIVVADRHKIIRNSPNESFFGHPPIYHVGWRVRQDNLWAMGPLDNLVGMQYRLDHVENLKADAFDLLTFPPLKIKGYVEDFEWGPFSRIYTGDDGDVEILAPPYQVLQVNNEIQALEAQMEQMAGAPKEALGFRTPGEKTAFEVQRLENAASRVFTNKATRFEEHLVERLLNAMLELAKRNWNPAMSTIPVFDDEFKITTFRDLTPADLTGSGTIRPIAARHFAEKAEKIQNLNNLFNSPLGQQPDVLMHFSGIETAKLLEDLLDLQDYELVQPYIRLSEQADAQRQAQSHQEQVQVEALTPSGLTADDTDQPFGVQ
jgi:hypothetical protein